MKTRQKICGLFFQIIHYLHENIQFKTYIDAIKFLFFDDLPDEHFITSNMTF